VRKIDRGPGKVVLCITRAPRTKDNEAITFKLQIKYLPPPTVTPDAPEAKEGNEF